MLLKSFLVCRGVWSTRLLCAKALRDAKDSGSQIVQTWIDLWNAYGSVRHNLIQYALNRYHVPVCIRELIFDYYNKLQAKVTTKQWETEFFPVEIGLFQGCVLSPILFNCVFQLLLDSIESEKCSGYQVKFTKVQVFDEAYADDLGLTTKSVKSNQQACDKLVRWLAWTRTMKAKPQKCVSMGFKQFDPRHQVFDAQFTALTDTIYAPFDPNIMIAGEKAKYVLDTSVADEFKQAHFKFLGRWINYNLNDRGIKQKISRELERDMRIVSDATVGGFIKLWLYQFYVLPRIAWPFMIQDLDISFVEGLEKTVNRRLKAWAGVYRSTEVGVLYRSKAHLGLGLTSISTHFKRMQLVKCLLLSESKDGNVRALFKARSDREETHSRVWRPTQLATQVAAEVQRRLQVPTQSDRKGLGSGVFVANPTPAQRRRLASTVVQELDEEKRIEHSVGLAQQSAWMQWTDTALPFDFSWQNFIYGFNDKVVRFVLNASVNWARTPDLLKTWGLIENAACVLCQGQQCTLAHILTGCKTALHQNRYTWRHDSVLRHLEMAFRRHFTRGTSLKQVPHLSSSFVKQGAQVHKPRPYSPPHLLDGASDWALLVDYDSARIVFPAEICATEERPDITIWSKTKKIVLLIELTCPLEENIQAAHLSKSTRYLELARTCTARGWTTHVLPIEVGARGFVARSVPRCLQRCGFSHREARRTTKQVSVIAARCSHTIYLSHQAMWWDAKKPLLASDSDDKLDPKLAVAAPAATEPTHSRPRNPFYFRRPVRMDDSPNGDDPSQD